MIDVRPVRKLLTENEATYGVHDVQVWKRSLQEEAQEAVEALDAEDLPHIAHELADVIYAAYGAARRLGIDLDLAVNIVHDANQSKIGPDGHPLVDANGKLLKGPAYTPPDCTPAVTGR